MEYILINDSKLKIILERDELAEWDINVDELDYANPVAKRVFEGLLGYAKQEFGFDTSGHKVLLQLYPSKDGGCELFITRLGENSDEKRRGSKKGITPPEQRAYSFDKLSDLLSVCKRLCHSGYSGDSSAWYDNYGKWFLLLTDPGRESLPGGSINDELYFIGEYGEAESPRSLSLYLCEYGNAVCEKDAALILGKI